MDEQKLKALSFTGQTADHPATLHSTSHSRCGNRARSGHRVGLSYPDASSSFGSHTVPYSPRWFFILTIQSSEIDTSYFVLTVDLWNPEGSREVNLVKHSSTSPSISAAATTSYPPEPMSAMYGQPMGQPIGGSYYPGYESAAQPYSGAPYPLPRQNELSRHMAAAQQASREEAMRLQQEGQHAQNSGHHHSLPKTTPRPGDNRVQNWATAAQSTGMTATTTGFYQQPSNSGQSALLSPTSYVAPVFDPRSQPGGMFTRNLIGSLAVGAFKLTWPDNDLGVWFILQDLSVRTEGSFRFVPLCFFSTI